MAKVFWPAVALVVIAVFMLIAGIGPLLLDIVLLLLGIVVAVVSKMKARQNPAS